MSTDSERARLQIEGYRMLEPAGAGSMGEVWRAEHVMTGAPVAVKHLPPNADARLAAFQEAEIRATAALDHPHIVRIVDTGATGEERWLVLEWCGGGTLEHVTDWATLADAILAVLAGLGHAHARGVLHRDVKPANVLRNEAGVWKLADFGVARIGDNPTASRVGSPAYIAPEVLQRKLPDQGPATDLYSLGCTIWEVVTGRAPFTGTRPVVFEAHLRSSLPRFHPRFDVPDALLPWLKRLLAKAPDDRPASAAEAAGTLVDPLVPWVPEIPTSFERETGPGRDTRLEDAGFALLPYREPPLHGRGPQLTSLWQRMSEVLANESPYVVLITGDPGVGRSRVARTLAQDAHARGIATWVGINLETAGLQPVRDLLGSVTPGALEVWRKGRPAVVILDDLDDPPTARAMGELVVGHAGPVLWLVTARQVPTQLMKRLPEDAWEEMALAPLASGEIGQLLRQVATLAPELNSQLARGSAGLPGHALDARRDWVAAGRLRYGPEGYALAPGGDSSSPVEPGLRRALELVALAGSRLPTPLWESACTMAGLELDWPAVFRFIEARGARIERGRNADTLALTPGTRVEDWVREAIETQNAAPACAALLALLPEDDERRGLLLLASGQTREGVQALLDASAGARRRGDRGLALERVRRGMLMAEQIEPPDPILLWAARNNLTQLLVDTWQIDRVVELQSAFEADLSAATPAQQATFWLRNATVHRYRGHHDATRAALERAEAMVEGDACTPAERGEVLYDSASQLVSIGDLAAAEGRAREALALAASDDARAYALLTLGRIETGLGRSEQALESLREGLVAARRAGRWITAVTALSMLGETSSRLGDLEAAAEHLQEASELAQSIPNFDGVMLELNIVANDLRRERWSEALSRLQDHEHDPRIRRLAIARVGVALLRMVAVAGLGRWDEFPDEVDELLAHLEKLPGLVDPDFLDFAERCEVLAADAPPEARAAAAEVLAVCRERAAGSA